MSEIEGTSKRDPFSASCVGYETGAVAGQRGGPRQQLDHAVGLRWAIDAGLIGAPASSASISASGQPEDPKPCAWRSGTTRPIRPTGNRYPKAESARPRRHRRPPDRCHRRARHIEQAIAGALTTGSPFVPVVIGGDHSNHRAGCAGILQGQPGKRVGVINFDAHFDVRNFEHGMHNGTPFRQIVEGLDQVDGSNVVELGIHGFMNAAHIISGAATRAVRLFPAGRCSNAAWNPA